jgi:hypothetical protein
MSMSFRVREAWIIGVLPGEIVLKAFHVLQDARIPGESCVVEGALEFALVLGCAQQSWVTMQSAMVVSKLNALDVLVESHLLWNIELVWDTKLVVPFHDSVASFSLRNVGRRPLFLGPLLAILRLVMT